MCSTKRLLPGVLSFLEEIVMRWFLIVSLFPLFAIFLGIKAFMVPGIEVWEGAIGYPESYRF